MSYSSPSFSSSMVSVFAGILSETIKTLFNNWNLFTSITSMTAIIYATLKSCNIVVAMQYDELTEDPVAPAYPSLVTALRYKAITILETESSFLFIAFFVSQYIITIITIAANAAYRNKHLSPKEVLETAAKSCIRPLITSFYITMFAVGYVCLVGFILFWINTTFLPFRGSQGVKIVLASLALAFFIYMLMVWSFGVVISVMEEDCYGIEAICKANKLLKGFKSQWFALNLPYSLLGFALNLPYGLLILIISQGSMFSSMTATQFLVQVLVVKLICIVIVISGVSHVVFYYKCKTVNNAVIKLQGGIEYSKLGITDLVEDDLP